MTLPIRSMLVVVALLVAAGPGFPTSGAASSAPMGAATSASGDGEGLVVVEVPNLQTEFSISANPTDPQNLVVGANDYASLVPGAGFFTSFDDGATWTHGTIPVPGGYPYSGEPAVVFDKDGNAFYAGVAYSIYVPGFPYQYVASDSALFVSKSTDGGLSWTTTLLRTLQEEDGPILDEPSLATDPATGAVYLTYTQYGGAGGIKFTKSTDAGLTWSPHTTAGVGVYSLPAAGESGDIYVTFRAGGGARFARSTDGGATWTLNTALPAIGVGWQLHPQWNWMGSYPAIDVARGGPHTGRIYLAATQLVQPDGLSDIVVTHSDDGGSTWSEPERIVRPGEQLMPWLAIMPDGTVGIAYMDTFLSPWTYGPPTPVGNAPFSRDITLLAQGISMKKPQDTTWTTVTVTDTPSLAGQSKWWGERQGLAATADGFHPAFSYAEPDLNICGCFAFARLDFATTTVTP